LKLRIWGNHSATQFPDFYNAKISGKPAVDVIKDDAWLKETFISTIQQRGAAVLRARGGSSAASAVDSAIVDRTDIPWRSDQCRSLGLKKA
jgi:malate dehydrogenase